jgi:hypothetical protein
MNKRIKVKARIADMRVDLVAKQVLSAVGTPERYQRITAAHVFSNNWRVNIWCYKPDVEQLTTSRYATIAYSYFVTADEDGKVLKSSPEFTPIAAPSTTEE